MENTMISAMPAKKMDIMSVIQALALGLAISAALPLPIYADQEDGFDLVPLVPSIPDIGGIWKYETSFPSERGPCPSGNAMFGEILVTTHPSGTTPPDYEDSLGEYVKVIILSGSQCRPESICHMAGYMNNNLVESGEAGEASVMGKVVSVGSSAVVDDEHGTVVNAWDLYFNSANEGVGSGSALYQHPDGSCEWAYDILLERSGKEGE